jgi:hypothetical protein
MLKCYDQDCQNQVSEMYTYCEDCKNRIYPQSAGSVDYATMKLREWATSGKTLGTPTVTLPPNTPNYSNLTLEELTDLEQKAEKWIDEHPTHPSIEMGRRRFETIKEIRTNRMASALA